MLEGQEFYVFTDHKPLCHALDLLSAACTQRYVALISEFTWDICYLPRDKNFATDALSWPPEHSCLAPVDLLLFLDPANLSTAQMKCSTTSLAQDQKFQVVRRLLASGHPLLSTLCKLSLILVFVVPVVSSLLTFCGRAWKVTSMHDQECASAMTRWWRQWLPIGNMKYDEMTVLNYESFKFFY